MLFFLGSFLLLQAVLGQDCSTSELEEMHECITSNLPELPEPDESEMMQKGMEFMEVAEECTEEVPECELPDESEMMEMMGKMQKMKEVMDCKQEIFMEKIQPVMETCMGDIPMPPPDKTFKIAFGMRMMMKHKKIIMKKMKEFCGGSRNKAKKFMECIKTNREDDDGMDMKAAFQKIKPCFQGKQDCLKMVIKKMCECGEKNLFNNRALETELTAAGRDCMAAAGVEEEGRRGRKMKLFGAPKKICMMVKMASRFPGGGLPGGGSPIEMVMDRFKPPI